MNAPALTRQSQASRHLTRRLIDALIREDVAGCLSQAQAIPAAATPHGPSAPDTWLRWELERGLLWLPVEVAHFMQPWRWSGDALLWQPRATPDSWQQLDRYDQVLDCLRPTSDDESLLRHQAYEAECDVAAEHGELCRQAQDHWFRQLCDAGSAWPISSDWAARLLFYDRLAAFLDHPFYPSARAKSGFDEASLRAYAPEFAPVFQLRWIAVPRERVQRKGDLPQCWPTFARVGLDPALAAHYQLLPVHPHLWDNALAAYLADGDLGSEGLLAPGPAVWVKPTLSVRTLQVIQEPRIHLKLPLTIRTLGARNIRTVKPSTLYDGDSIQQLLARVATSDPALAGRYSLTDESAGAHVDELTWLGVIVRRYPPGLDQATVVPIAALLATGADGRCVVEALAERFYGGNLKQLVREYLELTLGVHLRLWLKYGIALESNQQNSMLVLEHHRPLRLLLKDNDAPRLWPARLCGRLGGMAPLVDQLRDARIRVATEEPLAQMFTTITLQLNIAVLLEGLATRHQGHRQDWYRLLHSQVEASLQRLELEGVDTEYARRCLLEDDYLHAKYLLRAGSLETKAHTGAADINKFYGKSAPNFLKALP